MKSLNMEIFKRPDCTIDKKMLPMKLHYLFNSLAMGSVTIYFPLIAKKIGINATGLGVMFTVLPFLSLLFNPLFGYLTDKFKKITFVIIILTIILAPVHFSVNYIPEIERRTHSFAGVKLHCGKGNSSTFIESSQFTMKNVENNNLECQKECQNCNKSDLFNVTSGSFLNNSQILRVSNITLKDNITISICSQQLYDNFSVKCLMKDNQRINSFVHYQFWLFVILITLGDIIADAISALSDAACYEALEGRINQFGKQILWTSAGYGAMSMLAGYILDYANLNNKGKTDFSLCFYMMIPLMLIDIIILKFTDMRKRKSSSKNIFKDITKSFVELHSFFFVTGVFFVGLLSALQWKYSVWYLEELGGSKMLMGICEGVICFISDIPFMLISGWIIKRIGRDNSMSLAFISLSVWFLTASYIYEPWWILLAYMVQGPSFGLFYAVMTSYGKLTAAPGTEATMQTVLGAVFNGLGVGVGSLLGGIGFDKYSGRMTYRIAGYSGLCCAAVYKCVTLFIAGENSVIKETKEVEAEKPKIEDCS
ncbi:major facilitator superfamily domain-containing protein 6-like isoform X2 [Centruroides sculpturatus]|nr:major facilitator superfamily domain-containing protein 6-like isoform X2 [Centruroides sculpturatus]